MYFSRKFIEVDVDVDVDTDIDIQFNRMADCLSLEEKKKKELN